MFSAWITFGDACKDVFFPNQANWNSRVMLGQNETGWDSDVYIRLRALDGHMYMMPEKPIVWKDGSHREQEVKPATLYTLTELASRREISVVLRQLDRSHLCFDKYVLPSRKIVIGRSDTADIRDGSTVTSTEHGYISLGGSGRYEYRDHSANGTYLNGRKMSNAMVQLSYGDVLSYLSGVKLVFLGNCLAINRVPALKGVRLEKWRPKAAPKNSNPDEREQPSVYLEYQRAPRMMEKSETEDFELEAPLAKQEDQNMPMWLQLGPSMTMVLPMAMATMVNSFGGSGRGMMSSGLIMIGTSSALAVMWGIVNRKYREKNKVETEKRRVELYRRYIAEVEQALSEMNAKERRRLINTFPNTLQCADMPAAENGRNLWNRMPTHPDFLTVRVGMGEVDVPYEITVPKQKLNIIDDPLRDEPDRLKKTYGTIADTPITLPLRTESVVGILGGNQAILFAQGILMQIAALHSYHDVRIVVLTDEGSATRWSWTRWLPHVFASEDRQLRMVAHTAGDIHDVAAHLDDVLTMRKNSRPEDEDDDEEEQITPLPHYVVFCTDMKVLEDEPVMRKLLTNRQGMTLVMTARTMSGLPKECRRILNVSGTQGLLHSSEGDTRRVEYEYPDRTLLAAFSKRMAPLRVRDAAESAAIPTLVSFLDIYGVRKVEQLDVWRMWSENHTYDGLRSTIGYRAGSQPFILDISDKYHGPHGLIAGTTGSGKSVMLETYILSLALNYSPKQVHFILIDYKGGGMADAFRELPHTAGIIDNLQGERVISRALASLNGEIHRRELIFKEHKVNNINDYTMQYGEQPGKELPHLIIIVDEFAELKGDQPEFMRELVSASRVGRSLGIHLILATQKPSNSVSDEIWANSRFHLCLRVQTRQDSMEMLKRPDAAYIKGMGRCFIQIGNDELFEEVQTSYSGLGYDPTKPRAEEIPQMLTQIGHTVRVPKPPKAKGAAQEKETTQMTAVLERIYQVAGEHDVRHSRAMWLPELPRVIDMNSVELFKRGAWKDGVYANPIGNIRIPMGMADDVARQQYLPFVFDLTAARNLLICGPAGTGKTVAVQTMVYSLCSLYDADHVNIYLMSLTSRTLGSLMAFPQVGDIVYEGDVISMKRLLNMIIEEMNRRGELFAQASTDSFIEFNSARVRRGEKPVPAMVVFIDRFDQLKAAFANDDAYTAVINRIITEGSGRGIHLVATAMQKSEIPGRMQTFFAGIGLQLRDRSEFTEVLGKRVPIEMPGVAGYPGRGLAVVGEDIYEIQLAVGMGAPNATGDARKLPENIFAHIETAALPNITASDVDRAEAISAFTKKLSEQWKGELPNKIPRIPDDPTYEDLASMRAYKESMQKAFQLPIGYDMVQASLLSLDLSTRPSWLVHGTRRSGVTNLLKLAARTMRDRGADVHIFAEPGWKPLANAIGAKLYTTGEEMYDFVQQYVEYTKPLKPLKEAALEQGTKAALRQAESFKQICVIIDNVERLEPALQSVANPNALPWTRGLLSDLIAKGSFYNTSVLMGIASGDRAYTTSTIVRACVTQKRVIALGGKLTEYDPAGVSMAIPGPIKNRPLPLGQGYVIDNNDALQLVVPLAENEEA